METFGEKLKWEREDRGLRIQDVAEALGLDQDQLQALERNEFDSLPDDATMMACLRAYAERLEVDAELMIEDYTRERDACLQQLTEALPDPLVETVPITADTTAGQRPAPPRALVGMLILAAVAIAGAWWTFSGDATPQAWNGTQTASRTARPETPQEPVAAITAPIETEAAPAQKQPETTPAPPKPPVERPAPAPPNPAATATLSISDHGVGTAVENRQLVGRSDRFAEGTQVWFWTNVTGGTRGDRIDHVWLQDGVEKLRIPLNIGGSRWRTQSSKTLHAGAAGDWAVEARDDQGRVLARTDFVCTH